MFSSCDFEPLTYDLDLYPTVRQYVVLLSCSVNCVQDYATALDLMQELILATDVAEHVKVIREIEQMVEGVWKSVLYCTLTLNC